LEHADRTKRLFFGDHLSTVDGLAVLKQTAVALKLFFLTKGLKTHLTILKIFRKDITFAAAAHFKVL
jgi:hypothetical protein